MVLKSSFVRTSSRETVFPVTNSSLSVFSSDFSASVSEATFSSLPPTTIVASPEITIPSGEEPVAFEPVSADSPSIPSPVSFSSSTTPSTVSVVDSVCAVSLGFMLSFLLISKKRFP